MTNTEFSDQFDVLYNNITSNQAPGLDEYEKSVFLTRALDELVKAYFDPKGNKAFEGFDGSQRRQIDFSKILINVKIDVTITNIIDIRTNGVGEVDLPNDMMMSINEFVKVTRDGQTINLVVKTIDYEEYDRLMSKPYKRPLKWLAWRLIDASSKKSEIIVGPNDAITTTNGYSIRYVKKPRPIILIPLEDLTIDDYQGCNDSDKPVSTGATKGCSCELDSILHQEILQRAVELAKAAYTGLDLLTQMITIGSTSLTPKGMPIGGGLL